MTGTAIPILTRIYTPEDFGIFAVVGFIVVIASGRYEQVII